MEIRSLIVLRFSALGDVALLVPVLRALQVSHPTLTVHLVTRPAWKPLFTSLGNVSFVAADLEGRHAGFSGLLRLYAELRRLRPDAVADLHGVFRSRVLTSLFRGEGVAVCRLEKFRAERRAFLRTGVPPAGLRPIPERYLAVIRQLVPVRSLPPPPWIQPAGTPESLPFLRNVLPRSGKWICVAPFSRHPAKEWPFDRMRELLARLSDEGGFTLFCLAFGPRERSLADRLLQEMPHLQVVPENSGLAEQLTLLAHCDAALTMDSANMHLAWLCGTPVVSLWGPTHPAMGYGPTGKWSFPVQADADAAPWRPVSVYGKVWGRRQQNLARRAMELVTVPQVYESLQRALKSPD